MAGLDRLPAVQWGIAEGTLAVKETQLASVQTLGSCAIAWQPMTVANNPGNTCWKPKKRGGACRAQLLVDSVGDFPCQQIARARLGEKLGKKAQKKHHVVETPADLDTYAFQDYQFLFKGQRNEVEPIQLEVVEGSVPPDLKGTYYLQGPGILQDDHGSKVHPLDGHGYLRRFHFSDGIVEYSARYVQTEACQDEFDVEKKSWKFTYRGPFSLLKKGLRLGNLKVMKNVANTSVIEWAGKLMCLWEGGVPYEVDPKSLATAGILALHNEQTLEELLQYMRHKIQRGCQKQWDGSFIAQAFRKGAVAAAASILQPILMGIFKMPGERMLAHVKIDQQRQRLVCITCHPEDMLLPKSSMCIYEYDKDMNLVRKQKFTINDHILVHDWALTENHYIVFANRVKLNSLDLLGSALAGIAPMINAIAVNDSLPYTPMYLLPRNENPEQVAKPSRNWRVPVKVPKQFWLIHSSNAYEEQCAGESTRIVFDGTACSYAWFNLAKMFGYDGETKKLDPAVMNDCNSEHMSPMKLIRVSVTLPADGAKKPECEFQNWQNFPWSCDFPTTNPSVLTMKHEYTYVAATSGRRKQLQHFPFDTVAKISGPSANGLVASWWAGDRCFVGEPNFARKPGSPGPTSEFFEEDAGYLITIQHSATDETCYLVVLDAQKIGQEGALVCRLRVPKELSFPMGFHSSWDDSAYAGATAAIQESGFDTLSGTIINSVPLCSLTSEE